MRLEKIFENKKAVMENIIKILLWIVLFALLLVGIYFLIRRLTA